jgi:ABC-type dipeptide/oligopeptide/nickel transport system permease subunit
MEVEADAQHPRVLAVEFGQAVDRLQCQHASPVPGVAISLAVLGWNLLGDGLRDALDPRLTQ